MNVSGWFDGRQGEGAVWVRYKAEKTYFFFILRSRSACVPSLLKVMVSPMTISKSAKVKQQFKIQLVKEYTIFTHLDTRYQKSNLIDFKTNKPNTFWVRLFWFHLKYLRLFMALNLIKLNLRLFNLLCSTNKNMTFPACNVCVFVSCYLEWQVVSSGHPCSKADQNAISPSCQRDGQ